MKYEWDEEKRSGNIKKHGVDFIDIIAFEWDTAIISEDTREEYGEQRFVSYGFIEDRLHCVIFTKRDDTIRIISMRKANRKEQKNYEKTIS